MPFIIKSVASGMVAEVQNTENKSGAEVTLRPYNGGQNQLWEYKDNMIYSKLNGFVLDISGSKEGGEIITYLALGGRNQLWFFEDDFTIRSGTGMFLDIEGNTIQPGTKLIGYRKHGGSNQKFHIESYNNA